MSLDSIDDGLFAQERPKHICQNQGKMDAISKKKGHPCPCKYNRCSIPCYVYWCEQEGKDLSYYFEKHFQADERHAYRGNLKLPKGATPAEHRKAREEFQRALKRRCEELDEVKALMRCCEELDELKQEMKEPSELQWCCEELERCREELKELTDLRFRAYLHCTSHKEAHYDFIAHAPNGVDVETIIRESWNSVVPGGKATCNLLATSAERAKWSRYVAKGRRQDKNDVMHYVPLKGGLSVTWGSKTGFWGEDMNQDDIHKERVGPKPMRAELRPTSNDNYKSFSDNKTAPICDPAESAFLGVTGGYPKIRYCEGTALADRLNDLHARFPDSILVEQVKGEFNPIDPHERMRRDIRKILPTSPSVALTVSELEDMTGYPACCIEPALRVLEGNGVKRLDWGITPDGQMRRDVYVKAWERPRPMLKTRTPDNGVLTADEAAHMELMLQMLGD